MMFQSEAAECGLACIAMVVNHHGHQLDLTTLRNRYSVSLKGANMQQLMQLSNQLGLTPRALKLEINELKNLRTPCILHWEMNHLVVLKKIQCRGVLPCAAFVFLSAQHLTNPPFNSFWPFFNKTCPFMSMSCPFSVWYLYVGGVQFCDGYQLKQGA